MPEPLATILSPPDAVAGEWARRVREVDDAAPEGDDAFLAVTQALVRHLAEGDPLTCPEITELSVSALTVLRQVGHDRIGSTAEPMVVPELLTSLDGAVDRLLVDCVQGRMRDLEADAFADPLTGAGNRRALERDLRMFLAQVERYEHPLSIVMIDLDGLKAVNDVQGHDAGDALLRQLSTTFIAELRAGDAFYRVGGDEFVTVLPHSDRVAAEGFVERVRAVAPPFSAGVATAPLDGTGVGELIAVADQRLIRHRGPSRGRRRQTPPPQPAAARPPVDEGRIVVASVTTTIDWESTSVEVLLRQGGLERTGKCSGPALASAEPRIAATAALEAFQRLGYEVSVAGIESADVRRMAEREVVTVMITSREGEVEVVGAGSAVVRRGIAEAAATAVVQALGRTAPAREIIHV